MYKIYIRTNLKRIKIKTKMAAFKIETTLEYVYLPVATLPDFILESEHFRDWQALCLGEETFSIDTRIFITDLKIETKEDFNKVIECDAQLLFKSETRVEILRNIDNFWRTNPNASGLKLPKADMSWFSNQVITLFTERGSFMILMKCMKQNYIDLFEYIYSRDGESAFYTTHPFAVFPLLYYAIINNNIEILNRGLALNCPIRFDLFEPAIDKNNIEIVRILINVFKEKNLELRSSPFCFAAKKASKEIFSLLLDAYVTDVNEFCFNRCQKKIIMEALYNIENFKILLDRGLYIEFPRDYETLEMLFYECLKKSMPLETVLFLEERFEVKIDEFRKDKSKNTLECDYLFINSIIIEKDNIDLYTYLRSRGFYVRDFAEDIAKEYNCLKITPGLVHLHYEEEKLVKRYTL